MLENKLAGMVTLYNPEADVAEHVATYAEGLGRLYVVDNSPVPNTELVKALEAWPQATRAFLGQPTVCWNWLLPMAMTGC